MLSEILDDAYLQFAIRGPDHHHEMGRFFGSGLTFAGTVFGSLSRILSCFTVQRRLETRLLEDVGFRQNPERHRDDKEEERKRFVLATVLFNEAPCSGRTTFNNHDLVCKRRRIEDRAKVRSGGYRTRLTIERSWVRISSDPILDGNDVRALPRSISNPSSGS